MIASLACYLALVLVEIRSLKICRERGESIALLFVGLHGVIYYVTLALMKQAGQVDPVMWNTWSSALRLHGILTIVACALLHWRRLEKRNGCE